LADVLNTLERVHPVDGLAEVIAPNRHMIDWRALKFQRDREMEFSFAQDSVIDIAMNRSEPEQTKKKPGRQAWDVMRPAKVQRARALLKDPAYPSKKTLAAVADVLARGFTANRAGARPSNERR
jgi:hypothetical protein